MHKQIRDNKYKHKWKEIELAGWGGNYKRLRGERKEEGEKGRGGVEEEEEGGMRREEGDGGRGGIRRNRDENGGIRGRKKREVERREREKERGRNGVEKEEGERRRRERVMEEEEQVSP